MRARGHEHRDFTLSVASFSHCSKLSADTLRSEGIGAWCDSTTPKSELGPLGRNLLLPGLARLGLFVLRLLFMLLLLFSPSSPWLFIERRDRLRAARSSSNDLRRRDFSLASSFNSVVPPRGTSMSLKVENEDDPCGDDH